MTIPKELALCELINTSTVGEVSLLAASDSLFLPETKWTWLSNSDSEWKYPLVVNSLPAFESGRLGVPIKDNPPFKVEGKLKEMKVNKSKVMKAYTGVLNHMRKVVRKLNDDEMYEVTTQLKKWFNKNIM